MSPESILSASDSALDGVLAIFDAVHQAIEVSEQLATFPASWLKYIHTLEAAAMQHLEDPKFFPLLGKLLRFHGDSADNLPPEQHAGIVCLRMKADAAVVVNLSNS